MLTKVAIPFLYYSYTAVGVFVLGRMFREAWGSQASKKQAEFNEFLEVNLELDRVMLKSMPSSFVS